MTAACPKGHQTSTLDYCDVCGTPMPGAGPVAGTEATSGGGLPATPAPSAASAVAGAPESDHTPCPHCGTPRAGRFCEQDGYDFVLGHPPLGAPLDQPPTGTPPTETPPTDTPPTEPPAPTDQWQVVVQVDQAYFDLVIAQDGADAGALVFPRFTPDRRFALAGAQMLIGRRSRSRGIDPDIDLSGPPDDPGVSHSHAMLVNNGPAGWSIVDLGSANGTHLNDPSGAALTPHTPAPLGDGDRVYLGAWTALHLTATPPA